MKHLILFAFALLSAVAQAQTTLNVEKNSGSTETYDFSASPKLTFNGNNIVLKSDTKNGEYAISTIKRLTITKSGSSVTAPTVSSKACQTAIYSLDGKKQNTPHRGLNIFRQSDGTVRKIVKR